MCYSVHVLSLHGCVLFIIHVLQCTCAQSPWLCFIHYTCATVYMCSVSMTVFCSLYMCYSVHVLSLHGCDLFIIHVLQCTCAQSPWLCFIHYTCATVYMCSVSMALFYSLYMCYSVHVLSLHDCVLFIIHVLQCTCAQSPWLCFVHYTCATVYMCSVSMALFYPLYMCYSVHVLSLHGCVLFIIHVLQCTCAQSP